MLLIHKHILKLVQILLLITGNLLSSSGRHPLLLYILFRSLTSFAFLLVRSVPLILRFLLTHGQFPQIGTHALKQIIDRSISSHTFLVQILRVLFSFLRPLFEEFFLLIGGVLARALYEVSDVALLLEGGH